jgi:hypothetical protein
MSKIALTPNASGTGVFTIASPATNTDRTLTLPDEAGTVLVNGTTSNVGIGTSSPTSLLTLNKASNNTVLDLTFTGTAVANNYQELKFRVSGSDVIRTGIRSIQAASASFGASLAFLTENLAGAYSERLRISSEGNVGIGTSSPSEKLTVNGNINLPLGKYFYSYLENYGMGTPDSAGLQIFTGSTDSIRFGGRDSGTFTERMRIDSAGNVGIGTSSPNTKLDVVGSTTNSSGIVDTLRLRNTGVAAGDGAKIQFTAGTSTSGAGIGSGGVALNSADLRFYTGGNTERMRIDSSGNVGIGTSSPAKKLDVLGEAQISFNSVDTYLYYQSTSNYTGRKTDGNMWMNVAGGQANVFGINGVEKVRIDSSGNLLAGATSAVLSGKITSSFAGNAINGATFNDTTSASGAGFCIFSIAGTLIGNISRVGATSAVAYNTTSDQRLKSNIADSQSVLDKLMTVKVRQFDWTSGNVHQDYGFIAQELEPVLSGVVTKGKTDEDVWQLDYSKLTPHLLKAIQEQQAIITALETRLSALEG